MQFQNGSFLDSKDDPLPITLNILQHIEEASFAGLKPAEDARHSVLWMITAVGLWFMLCRSLLRVGLEHSCDELLSRTQKCSSNPALTDA